MAKLVRMVKYCNQTEGLSFQPSSSTNTNPVAGSEYDAATISGIAFGIFMALLAMYSIWQYGQQYMRIYNQFLRQGMHNTESTNNTDIETEDVERGQQRNSYELEDQRSEET